MKFKYNFLENRLWRIDGKYFYETAEDNYFRINHPTYGTDGFRLGENYWITFTLELNKIQVFYQQGTIAYQKILALPKTCEIICEFSEEDLVSKT